MTPIPRVRPHYIVHLFIFADRFIYTNIIITFEFLILSAIILKWETLLLFQIKRCQKLLRYNSTILRTHEYARTESVILWLQAKACILSDTSGIILLMLEIYTRIRDFELIIHVRGISITL